MMLIFFPNLLTNFIPRASKESSRRRPSKLLFGRQSLNISEIFSGRGGGGKKGEGRGNWKREKHISIYIRFLVRRYIRVQYIFWALSWVLVKKGVNFSRVSSTRPTDHFLYKCTYKETCTHTHTHIHPFIHIFIDTCTHT